MKGFHKAVDGGQPADFFGGVILLHSEAIFLGVQSHFFPREEGYASVLFLSVLLIPSAPTLTAAGGLRGGPGGPPQQAEPPPGRAPPPREPQVAARLGPLGRGERVPRGGVGGGSKGL